MAINQNPVYVADDEATFMSSYKVHQVATSLDSSRGHPHAQCRHFSFSV